MSNSQRYPLNPLLNITIITTNRKLTFKKNNKKVRLFQSFMIRQRFKKGAVENRTWNFIKCMAHKTRKSAPLVKVNSAYIEHEV